MTEQFEHGYAVIIGVDENNISPWSLPVVKTDVRELYRVLVHPARCGYLQDNVRFLSGVQSTRTQILDSLDWLQKKVEVDSDATAIVYYSGHGKLDKTSAQYYLVPYDIASPDRIYDDAITAHSINARIANLKPKRLLVILDCCHSDGMDVKDIDFSMATETLSSTSFPVGLSAIKGIPDYDPQAKDITLLASGEGRAILNSSQGSEKSYIRKDGKMSIFTYHLIEALTGHAPQQDEDDKVVDVGELMSYVTHHVSKTANNEGRKQTPVMRTTGIFPVALLMGGEGLSKSAEPPNPYAPLPEINEPVASSRKNRNSLSERAVLARDVDGHIITGDKNKIEENISFSGDFSGSILNVRSKLENVHQQIGQMPLRDSAEKAKLKELIVELNAALQSLPEGKTDDAETISMFAETLVDNLNKPKPNKKLIEITGESLKRVAKDLAEIAPLIFTIANQFVETVGKIIG